MQQLQSNVPEPLNQFPDCVSMKLHSQFQAVLKLPKEADGVAEARDESISVRLESLFKIKRNYLVIQQRQADLHLTIRFGKQEILLPNQQGRVVFGLKKGELKLKISQGRIPLETMGLTAPFQKEIAVEQQDQEGIGGEASFSKEPGFKLTGSSSIADKVQYKLYQVRSRGTEIEPVWVFEEQCQDCLNGSLSKERLGTVVVEGNDCVVMATFEVSSHQTDIFFSQIDELLPPGIFNILNRNKQIHICKEFFTRCVLPKLQQPISQLEHQLT